MDLPSDTYRQHLSKWKGYPILKDLVSDNVYQDANITDSNFMFIEEDYVTYTQYNALQKVLNVTSLDYNYCSMEPCPENTLCIAREGEYVCPDCDVCSARDPNYVCPESNTTECTQCKTRNSNFVCDVLDTTT